MGNALRHSEPIYRNRPVRYDQYVETGKLENEEPLYRREQKLLADNPVPVSYTHLDVYKRQIHSSL